MLKRGNKIYIVFLCVTIPLFFFFMFSNLLFSNEKPSVSENYQKTLDFSNYYLKIDNATYNTDTKEVEYTAYLKTKYDNGQTKPNIYSISVDYALDEFAKYNVSHDTSNEFAERVTISDINDDFRYIRIFYQSQEPDIYVAETTDEFGNILPAQTIEGEMQYISIIIDKNDMLIINNNTDMTQTATGTIFDEENAITQDSSITVIPTTTANNVSHDTLLTTAKSATTESISATTPKVTTTAMKTSQKTTQRTATTSKESAVATKPTTSEKLTATKTPASISKITTTTKKVTTTKKPTTTTKKTTTVTTTKAPKVTTTTTTSKKVTTTTTTTKKVTTTKKPTTTTKKVTTTTVYIKLTGLALLEKGSEELLLGQSVTLTPVYTPSKATNKKVYWKSNRTDRVVVDSNGKCTAVGTGSAIITCTSDDGGLTAAYMITGVDG